ncbi:hypothetical protein PybrP1_003907 [[Pythium] brassicae (nom. inval.)]|nr:hypothetical protein PybrP1_003907 [[Pythium] brassicae (nom. inval.)]
MRVRSVFDTKLSRPSPKGKAKEDRFQQRARTPPVPPHENGSSKRAGVRKCRSTVSAGPASAVFTNEPCSRSLLTRADPRVEIVDVCPQILSRSGLGGGVDDELRGHWVLAE